MTSKIRIEYVRPRRGGEAYGIADNVIRKLAYTNLGALFPPEVIEVGAVNVQSSQAPVFENDLGLQGGVFGRITCMSGAVVIAPPIEGTPSPIATQANGLRLEAGQEPLMLPIETGQRFGLIESTIASRLTGRFTLLSNGAASGAPVSGIPAGSYLWTMQGTFGGATATLRVLGPDGVNYMDLETMTAPGRKGVVLGEGDTVRLFITGGNPANLYSELG